MEITFSAACATGDGSALPPPLTHTAVCGTGDMATAAEEIGSWKSGSSGRAEADGGAGGEGDEVDGLSVGQLKSLLDKLKVDRRGVFEKSEMRSLARAASAQQPKQGGALPPPLSPVAAAWRRWSALNSDSGSGRAALSDSQLAVLCDMLQDHVLGSDCCVLAQRGAGKSTVVRKFASLLGYSRYATFCHQDMSSHELLQRRTTDAEGSTLWLDSPLLLAALSGNVAVLDGVHRLAPGTLAGALAPLLSDRSSPTLPDGGRLVSPEHWARLLTTHLPSELAAKKVRSVHPAFRVIACAEPPTVHDPWLTDEILSLFSFHSLPELSPKEQRSLVALDSAAAASAPVLRALLNYEQAQPDTINFVQT